MGLVGMTLALTACGGSTSSDGTKTATMDITVPDTILENGDTTSMSLEYSPNGLNIAADDNQGLTSEFVVAINKSFAENQTPFSVNVGNCPATLNVMSAFNCKLELSYNGSEALLIGGALHMTMSNGGISYDGTEFHSHTVEDPVSSTGESMKLILPRFSDSPYEVQYKDVTQALSSDDYYVVVAKDTKLSLSDKALNKIATLTDNRVVYKIDQAMSAAAKTDMISFDATTMAQGDEVKIYAKCEQDANGESKLSDPIYHGRFYFDGSRLQQDNR